jgi:hypothetical protein
VSDAPRSESLACSLGVFELVLQTSRHFCWVLKGVRSMADGEEHCDPGPERYLMVSRRTVQSLRRSNLGYLLVMKRGPVGFGTGYHQFG